MKKIRFDLVCALITMMNLSLGQTVFAQGDPKGFPLYDVQIIKDNIEALKNTASADTAQNIAARITAAFNLYFPAGEPAKSYADLKARLVDNNYLNNVLPDLPARVALTVKPVKYNAASVNGSPEAGMFSANAIGDMLATFIADRFKQEIEIAYLKKLKDWLNADPTLAALLPNTLIILNQNNPYEYTVFFEALKEAMSKDISNLPANFGNFMATDPYKLSKSNLYYYPEVALYQSTIKIIYGSTPTLVLNNLDQDALIKDRPDAFSAVMKMASMFSRALTNPDQADGRWMSAGDIESSLSDPFSARLFIGLFLLKNKNELRQIKLNDQILYSVINDGQAKINQVVEWINRLANSYEELANYTNAIQSLKKGFKEPSGKLISEYSSAIVNSISALATFPLVNWDTITNGNEWHNALLMTSSFMRISSDIADSNYGLALAEIVNILTIMGVPSQTITVVKNYGNFAVSIAVAKTSAEREEALNAAALPVGSYRIKRNSYINISFNAYAGFFGGVQKYSGAVPPGVKKTNGTLGFTAPVGLAYSWGSWYHSGKKQDSLKGASNTIFLSIIDVGAITAFRLTHDSTATLPEFTWTNILAPGIFYVYGFRNSPVSLGGGIQYGPQLRSVENNVATTLPNAFTIRLFCVIDIPIFNFYTRTDLKSKP
jgi:hypothetical protein